MGSKKWASPAGIMVDGEKIVNVCLSSITREQCQSALKMVILYDKKYTYVPTVNLRYWANKYYNESIGVLRAKLHQFENNTPT